jgi:hypothetical protein
MKLMVAVYITLKMETTVSPEMLILIYEIHGVTRQKTILIFTGM